MNLTQIWIWVQFKEPKEGKIENCDIAQKQFNFSAPNMKSIQTCHDSRISALWQNKIPLFFSRRFSREKSRL